MGEAGTPRLEQARAELGCLLPPLRVQSLLDYYTSLNSVVHVGKDLLLVLIVIFLTDEPAVQHLLQRLKLGHGAAATATCAGVLRLPDGKRRGLDNPARRRSHGGMHWRQCQRLNGQPIDTDNFSHCSYSCR